jgi:hypothetical protein
MKDLIAFFSLEPTQDKKGVIGAMLVTDDLGMPQEFRVTFPIKPTSLQQRLYGDSLVTHLGVTLCGEPLYNALRLKPELLVVSQPQYLSLAKNVEAKVAHIKRLGEAIVVDDDKGNAFNKKMHSKSGRYQPINIFFPNNIDDAEVNETTAMVEKYFQRSIYLNPLKE